ncbi:alpha/beta fold hydrolase [Pseudomonas sp. F1_0610]|uniref:alpha/beta hydrolase family protein n=1 Tax=Pseudomonas sp. F1_0610 TaxID=3114284 RepID=UPI0039C3054D
MQPITISCADGLTLRAHLFKTQQQKLKGVVQLNPATGVPERLYYDFAQALSEQGYDVLTYNYRGVSSHKQDSKKVRAGFTTWADLDVEAVTEYLAQHYPHLPHFAVGHSFGGHAIGLCKSTRYLTAAILISSHTGCIRFIRPLSEWLKAALMLKLIGPVSSWLCGYFPGKALKFGENMPAQVMYEWYRWTSMPNYFFDDASVQAVSRFAQQQLPILSIGFADDPWAPSEAIDLLAKYFVNSPVERRQFQPSDSNYQAIGHINFFRKRHEHSLWPFIYRWLEQQNAK